METTSKYLLSPKLSAQNTDIVQTGYSASWHNSTDQPSKSTLRPHSKLRPCRSLDTRIRKDDSATNTHGIAEMSTANRSRDDVRRITGSTSELAKLAAQPPCGWTYDHRHQQRPDVDERIQSARDRPQSAWKSRRQGRQPNFTFTDIEGAECSNGTVAPTTSRSGSFEMNDDSNEEIRLESMKLLRLHDEYNDDNNVDETIQTRLTGREQNVSPSTDNHRDEVTVSPLPVYNPDRRRRHSLYGGPSIVISVPTVVHDLPRYEDRAMSRAAGATDGNEIDDAGHYEDNSHAFRKRSLTDTEHDAARKRALARLTGNESTSSFRDTAEDDARIAAEVSSTQRRRLSACKGQLPRKLDPLFSA